jgi:hypothetical protein
VTEAVNHPPRLGTVGEATPAQAERWLEEWAIIGGGVTITVERLVNPWRFISPNLTPEGRALADRIEADMLRELDETPGLAAAIRAVTASNALLKLGRALNEMGKRR